MSQQTRENHDQSCFLKITIASTVLVGVCCVGVLMYAVIGTELDWIPDSTERAETAVARAATQEVKQAAREAQSTIFALTATSTATRTPPPTNTPGPTKIPVTKRDRWTFYAVTNANLRPCPQVGEACAPAEQLTYGEPVQVTGEVEGDAVQGNTRWFRVSHDDHTLFVHSSMVAEVHTAWATGIETCTNSSSFGELVLPDHINVWNGPGDNRKRIVGTLSHSQEVQILDQRQDKDMDDDRLYYKIRTADGLEGWLGHDFLQFKPTYEGFIAENCLED